MTDLPYNPVRWNQKTSLAKYRLRPGFSEAYDGLGPKYEAAWQRLMAEIKAEAKKKGR